MAQDRPLLYIEIYQKLYRMILNSPKIYKIKSERALAEEFGVSRITIRHSLKLLEEKGIVRRKGRSATLIREHPFHHYMDNLYSLKEEMQLLGVEYTVDILELVCLPCTAETAAVLHIPEKSPVHYAQRLIRVGDTPFIYEESFFPVSIFPSASKEDLVITYDFIQKITGSCVQAVNKKITAEIAPKEVCKILHLPYPSAALHIQDQAILEDGRICQSVNLYFHPEYVLTTTSLRSRLIS